jgi:hypothetical protein
MFWTSNVRVVSKASLVTTVVTRGEGAVVAAPSVVRVTASEKSTDLRRNVSGFAIDPALASRARADLRRIHKKSVRLFDLRAIR